MVYFDETQDILSGFLTETKSIFEHLLTEKFGGGQVQIVTSLDLGFPHDVIRLAGGFATGAYVHWDAKDPIIPVDTCVNDCAVSFFEIDKDIRYLFTQYYISQFESRMANTAYKLNFHRGNHFILFVRSIKTGKYYLVLHSSANEFKDNYNGLYPAETNYVHECLKVYNDCGRYIRYLDGSSRVILAYCRPTSRL